MDREDVNELILDEVDDIEDDSIRQYIDDILRFERSHINMDQPQYKSDYNSYLTDQVEDWSSEDN